MNLVEPIRDPQKINTMKRVLHDRSLRDYVLFTLGINSGLRISDLLKLRVADVLGKDRIRIKESKTGKIKDFPISESCAKGLREYFGKRRLRDQDWLFPSRQGGHLTRIQAWRIINQAAKSVGVTENVGTHSLRKTFGYHAYTRGSDITIVQRLLNHSSPGVTMRYIGITRDELDAVHLNLNL